MPGLRRLLQHETTAVGAPQGLQTSALPWLVPRTWLVPLLPSVVAKLDAADKATRRDAQHDGLSQPRSTKPAVTACGRFIGRVQAFRCMCYESV